MQAIITKAISSAASVALSAMCSASFLVCVRLGLYLIGFHPSERTARPDTVDVHIDDHTAVVVIVMFLHRSSYRWHATWRPSTVSQHGNLVLAPFHALRAPGVEFAPGRRAGGRRECCPGE